MPSSEARGILKSLRRELLLELYRDFADTVRSAGAVPVWAFVRLSNHPEVPSGPPEIEALAREAGFEVLVVHDLFEGVDRREVEVSRSDEHPNARGHAMIAEALYEQLRQNHAALGMGLVDAVPKPAAGR
jgi:hypothetical protein